MLLIIAIVASGLFAGAAIYINLVEHPARLSCGAELAVKEFAPSYARATVLQASLAVAGCLAGLASGWQRSDFAVATAAMLFGLVVPFTLVVSCQRIGGCWILPSMGGARKPRRCCGAGGICMPCAVCWRSRHFLSSYYVRDGMARRGSVIHPKK